MTVEEARALAAACRKRFPEKRRVEDFFWTTLDVTTTLLSGISIGILAALSMRVLGLSSGWAFILAILSLVASLSLSLINHRKRGKLLKRWQDFSDRHQELLATSPIIARYHAELRFLAYFGSPSGIHKIRNDPRKGCRNYFNFAEASHF